MIESGAPASTSAPASASASASVDGPGEGPRVSRWPAALLFVAGLAGVAATFMQTLDKIALLKNPKASLVCDVNGALSCSNVLNAWQSSALRVPNSLIGLVVFTLFLASGLSLLLGSRLTLAYVGVLQFFALFMLGFVLWFLWQSTFVIHSLCLYCTVVGTSTVLVNAVVPRLLIAAGGLQGGGLAGTARRTVEDGDDRWLWLGLWAAVAIVMAVVLA